MSPLRQLLAEVRDARGGVRLDDIARRVGVARDEAAALVDYWVARGELAREEVAGGCPPAGCGGCALARACGVARAGGPASRPEPLLFTIRAVRPPQPPPVPAARNA